jgi:hypothetical protein
MPTNTRDNISYQDIVCSIWKHIEVWIKNQTITNVGTFDVTILSIEEGLFEVKSTAGNGHLGEKNEF